MEQEIWKPIKGYEERYRISNKGRVFSIKSNKILSPKINTSSGYYQIGLYCGSRTSVKFKYIHKLVCESFVPNPNNYRVTNHINGNKLDNRVENLEWCTDSENTKHAYCNNFGNFKHNASVALDKANSYIRKNSSYVLIILINKENKDDVLIFKSTMDIAKHFSITTSKVCHYFKHAKSMRGYIFSYFKNKDLQKFANGEPLPEVLKGIPWEDYIIKDDIVTCNDYSSEGK